MKLRNKKTGEQLVMSDLVLPEPSQKPYHTLADLIDEWEDVPEKVDCQKIFNNWKDNGIKPKLTRLIVAPENVTKAIAGDIGTEYDGKMYFTWDEAMELEEKVLKPNGWRLPTRSEWALLCEEFGQEKNGKLNGEVLSKNLNLPMNGWLDSDGDQYSVGSNGYYWSSTIYTASNAYFLDFDSFSASTGNNYKRNGFSVRCMKETKDDTKS